MENPLCPDEPDFRVIETFGFRTDAGFVRLEAHLDRMGQTADALGIAFDRAGALAILQEQDGPSRCRLTLDANGRFDVTYGALTPSPAEWRVAIAPERLRSDDPWLRHKTTRRAIYDQARANLPEGVDEWLFLNERGELCEGTITNLFVGNCTPALDCGLLPGILRGEFMADCGTETVLTPDDLRDGFAVGNSLRGFIPAMLI